MSVRYRRTRSSSSRSIRSFANRSILRSDSRHRKFLRLTPRAPPARCPHPRALYDNHLVKTPFSSTGARRYVAEPTDPDVEIAVLTAVFDARPGSEEVLLGALSRYVVLTRQQGSCRNVDLVASITRAGRFVVIEKWDSSAAVQAHLDSPLMTEMAHAVVAALASKPEIDMLESISAYDLSRARALFLAKQIDRDLGLRTIRGAGLLAYLA